MIPCISIVKPKTPKLTIDNGVTNTNIIKITSPTNEIIDNHNLITLLDFFIVLSS